MATNVEARVQGNKLILEVDLTQDNGSSSTGKSIKVASSDGNMPVPGHPEIKFGLNVYKPIQFKPIRSQ